MQDIVYSVQAKIKITFSDGQTYDIPMKSSDIGLKTFCSSIDIEEKLYTSSSTNIVGNICGNTLSIELISNDGILIPTNTHSVYYGLMNDSAVIDIYFHIKQENIDVYMGRYYVDTWECGADSDKSNEVSISAVDLISKIKNIPLGKMRLRRNIKFVEYIKQTVNTLNITLPENMQIFYNDDDLDIYRKSKYAWEMEYSNINRDTVETMFNNIAKDTISYIWIDRDRYVKTDHLLDDTEEEAVSTLSGSMNLLNYSVQSGDIDKYSGVTVKYLESISTTSSTLLELVDITLNKGMNNILDRKMRYDNVDTVELIEIQCEEGHANCLAFDFYKDSINMFVESTHKTKAKIVIYGKYVVEDVATITKYRNEEIKDSLIEVENKTLRKELMNTYVDGLINLMTMKNNIVSAKGFINPQIRLGNTVQFIGGKFNVNDYYKVIGLKYSLNSGKYDCTATLLKTIGTIENVDDILYQQNELLYDCITGVEVSSSELNDITEKENLICEDVLSKQLIILRD